MRHLKMLGLLTVAAIALMAFANSVSATTLTSATGTTYTGTFEIESEGSLSFEGAFTTVSCGGSNISGTIASHGAAVTAAVPVTKMTFTTCNFPLTVETAGTLEVHPVKTNASLNQVEACTSGECTGVLTSSGTKINVQTSVGSCVFSTTNTALGILTPSNDTGSTATVDIGGHGTGKIPRTGGNFLCGSSWMWTGSYSVTTPDGLWIDSGTGA